MESNPRPCRVSGRVTLVAAAALACSPSLLSAQQTGAVAGTVRDPNLGPLAAAAVFVPGTGLRALTDAQGSYRIEGVRAGTVEVRVQQLGYAAAARLVQVQAGATVTVDFALSVEAVGLDELLVTVTGLQRRRELGNTTATLQAPRELDRAAPASLITLLQGGATGVQVRQSSGTVGGSASLKIRGNTSINLSNTPLIYVDGTRVSNDMTSGPGVGGQTTSRLNDLNLDDIESIEIVKGPSAATLYGLEAAPGVIRITTKRGRPGATEWTLKAEWGASWDATEWPETVWSPRSLWGERLDVSELFAVGEVPPGVYFATIPDTLYTLNLLEIGRAGEDVYATPWRTGAEQATGISLRGGMDNVTYFLSGEFDQQDGTLANNESTRRNLRVNLNVTPSPRVEIAVSSAFSSSEVSLPDNDNNAFGYLGVGMLAFPWEMAIRRRDVLQGGEVITCPFAFEAQRAAAQAGLGISLTSYECADNPFLSERTFEDVATLANVQKMERFIGSASLIYRPTEFLTARATVGFDGFTDQTGAFIPVEENGPFGDLSRGYRGISHLVERNLTTEGALTGTFDLTSTIRSTTSVGVQFFRERVEAAASVGRELAPGSTTVSGAVKTEGSESVGERRRMGIFVQQQLGYRDRVYVTPGFRLEESSTFGEDQGTESLPRVGASWVVSEEDWFEDSFVGSFLQSLRLRGAWGVSGKQPGDLAALRLLGAQAVTFQEADVVGLTLGSLGNPDLKPEKSQEVELGFDAELWEGRLGLDFTWYRKVATDAIVARPLPPSSGYSAIPTNIGEMVNSGIELGLSAVAWNTPTLRWDWQVNAARVTGEITELEEPIIFGLGGGSQRHQKGNPRASYFGRTYRMEGGQVVASDSAEFVGQPTPELEGSVSTTLTLFGWMTLHANLGFALGHQQFNSTEEFRCGFLGGGTNGGVCPQMFEVREDGQRTDQARIKAQATDDNQVAPWIEDADYARLRTVSARFDLPDGWVRRVGARRASFTVVGENLALFTGYTGIDPEINFAGGAPSLQAEFLTLPPARRVVGRLSITF